MSRNTIVNNTDYIGGNERLFIMFGSMEIFWFYGTLYFVENIA